LVHLGCFLKSFLSTIYLVKLFQGGRGRGKEARYLRVYKESVVEMKINEELGKLAIHIELENDVQTFYILNDKMHYQYDSSEVKEMNQQLNV
jgi:hypothetical protein